jgi:hypothetical protein
MGSSEDPPLEVQGGDVRVIVISITLSTIFRSEISSQEQLWSIVDMMEYTFMEWLGVVSVARP